MQKTQSQSTLIRLKKLKQFFLRKFQKILDKSNLDSDHGHSNKVCQIISLGILSTLDSYFCWTEVIFTKNLSLKFFLDHSSFLKPCLPLPVDIWKRQLKSQCGFKTINILVPWLESCSIQNILLTYFLIFERQQNHARFKVFPCFLKKLFQIIATQ